MSNEFLTIHSIITFFNKQFEEKTGRKCLTNRNKVKYLIADILRDIDVEELKSLVKYYIETDKEPSLQKFCFEYDEIAQYKKKADDDKVQRISLLTQTRKSVLEFRERYKN